MRGRLRCLCPRITDLDLRPALVPDSSFLPGETLGDVALSKFTFHVIARVRAANPFDAELCYNGGLRLHMLTTLIKKDNLKRYVYFGTKIRRFIYSFALGAF